MYLDEKLLQKEIQDKKREERKKHIQDIKEEILRQEREQKPVEDWIHELDCKLVDINGKQLVCEKKKVMGNHISIFIFPEDVEKIIENNNAATVVYRTLDIATNTGILHQPIVIRNQKEFQDILIKQYAQDKLSYSPLESGILESGKYKICFAEGSMTSAIGGVFINNFVCSGKKRAVIGNYTCRLVQRYSYKNLFRAMLTKMFEEDR